MQLWNNITCNCIYVKKYIYTSFKKVVHPENIRETKLPKIQSYKKTGNL